MISLSVLWNLERGKDQKGMLNPIKSNDIFKVSDSGVAFCHVEMVQYWISKVCFSKVLWKRCGLICVNKTVFTTNSLKPRFFFLIPLWSLLFPQVESPNSLSLSLYQTYSSSLTISIALYWACCSSSMSLLYWRPQNWPQHSRLGLARAE